jgi:RecA/RadA recombinase
MMKINDLLAKLMKNSKVKESNVLSKSIYFDKKNFASTIVPMMNVALSGRLDGGLGSGLTQFAGESKHFKTLFCLVCAKAYMDKYPEAVMIFYDSEFGSPLKYFDSLGIDRDRVLHTPLENIDIMATDLLNQMKNLTRGDRVIFVVDSIGGLASVKELKDTQEGKETVDLTRPKKLKAFSRMITPLLVMKDVPVLMVNHIYQTMEMYATNVVSGGQGLYLASDNIFIIGRQAERDEKTKKTLGYNFILNIEKSRYTKEKQKIAINVTFEDGISKYSGLLENAVEMGIILKERKGTNGSTSYARKGKEEILSEDDTNNKEFWEPILADKQFQSFIEKKYALGDGPLISEG